MAGRRFITEKCGKLLIPQGLSGICTFAKPMVNPKSFTSRWIYKIPTFVMSSTAATIKSLLIVRCDFFIAGTSIDRQLKFSSGFVLIWFLRECKFRVAFVVRGHIYPAPSILYQTGILCGQSSTFGAFGCNSQHLCGCSENALGARKFLGREMGISLLSHSSIFSIMLYVHLQFIG